MRKNVMAKELAVGDTVKMSHQSEGAYTSMMVTEIDGNGVTCTRPYLVPSSDTSKMCELSGKLSVRPHIGLEPVWFPLDGSMEFDVLSESYVTVS